MSAAWKRKKDFENDCDSATSYFHSRMVCNLVVLGLYINSNLTVQF